MTQVSWNGSASTIPTFIGDLFAADVRSVSALQTAVAGGALSYSFTDDTTRGLILNAWLAAWQAHNGDTFNSNALGQCPQTDQVLIGFLSDQIKNGSLSLCTPNLTYVSPQPAGSKYAVYANGGYTAHPFLTDGAWNYGEVSSAGQVSAGSFSDSSVVSFLSALFHGAHCVVVSNADDLRAQTAPPQFWNQFTTSGITIGADKFNSHYADLANFTGYYYLNITDEHLPPENPLLVAFLVGLTDPAETADYAKASGEIAETITASLVYPLSKPPILKSTQDRRAASNTFIQLEGWQNHLPYAWPGNKKHRADFATHEATLWNFSTFGACAYSEKRCTPIFLAGSGFSLSLDATTHMPLYNGAASKQSWMQPSLLQISSAA